jgi:8-oxo-dGTP pyrophosphatase MutT (NUDIX family)
MQVVYAREPFPSHVTKTIFLAGPTPRANPDGKIGLSWRPEAIRILQGLGYDGHVFVPEPLDHSKWVDGYEDQIEWEEEGLNRADCIVFWVPRDMTGSKYYGCPMPGLTTNDEWGTWKDSGKVVWGDPGVADHVGYQRYYARKLGVPGGGDLKDTLQKAIAMVGGGAERSGGECQVPLHVWRKREFQAWLRSQKAADNRLDRARVIWAFYPKPGALFAYCLHVHVYIRSENRTKENEFILGRSDVSMVVLYRGKEVVLVREFRSPVRNAAGFVYELAGGSSWRTDEDPGVVAAHEVEEEVGLVINPSRFTEHGARQLAATWSIHMAHLFSAELSQDEIDRVRAGSAVAHGVIEDTERTYAEVWKLKDILERQLVDWTTLGMILSVVK